MPYVFSFSLDSTNDVSCFYPVKVTFASDTPLCHMAVAGVTVQGSPVRFSSDVQLEVTEFEIV